MIISYNSAILLGAFEFVRNLLYYNTWQPWQHFRSTSSAENLSEIREYLRENRGKKTISFGFGLWGRKVYELADFLFGSATSPWTLISVCCFVCPSRRLNVLKGRVVTLPSSYRSTRWEYYTSLSEFRALKFLKAILKNNL